MELYLFNLLLQSGPDFYNNPAEAFAEPFEIQHENFPNAFKYFYLAQLVSCLQALNEIVVIECLQAIWIYTCFIHRFIDERRSDYFVMYSHHIFTICLVGVSEAFNHHRIGLLVLFVHDASDITVDLLKMINYLKLEGPRGWFASEIIFVVNLGIWIFFRLVKYPILCLWPSYVDCYWNTITNPAKQPPNYPWVWYGVWHFACMTLY